MFHHHASSLFRMSDDICLTVYTSIAYLYLGRPYCSLSSIKMHIRRGRCLASLRRVFVSLRTADHSRHPLLGHYRRKRRQLRTLTRVIPKAMYVHIAVTLVQLPD